VLNFTTQERAVLLFLASTLVLGGILGMIRDRRRERSLDPVRFVLEAKDFDSVSARLNQPAAAGEERPESGSVNRGDEPRASVGKQETAGRININKATPQQLESLPGIGPALAARIIAYRQAVGSFQTPAEITDVKGIGDGLYGRIADHIRVE